MFRVVAALALVSSAVGAQSLSDVPTMLDGAIGVGSGVTSLSVAASRATYVGTSDRFKVGFTLRMTGLASDGLKLAPTDPRGVFNETRDTLAVTGTALLVNAGVNMSLQTTARSMIGMNIDLFGFGTGPSQTATYRATPDSTGRPISSKPAGMNIFAGGSGDRGSLNSEFFFAWMLNDKYTLRGGLSHQLVEYKVSAETIASNTPRFRRFANLVFVGLRYTMPQ